MGDHYTYRLAKDYADLPKRLKIQKLADTES